jgi:hypothetical protein
LRQRANKQLRAHSGQCPKRVLVRPPQGLPAGGGQAFADTVWV